MAPGDAHPYLALFGCLKFQEGLTPPFYFWSESKKRTPSPKADDNIGMTSML